VDISPFSDEHLDGAAALLEARHARQREAEPRLPEDVDLRAEVAALWSKDGASGAVAVRDGRVVGYAVGTRLDDALWGPNAWIELAGHAVEEAEDVRDLYAFLAERWVADGRRAHYVYVPASDAALVEAWFRLGFGQQHALAIRALPGEPPETTDGVEVRVATERDVDALVALEPLLREHQARSPVFSAGRGADPEDVVRAELEEDLANPQIGNLVAEVDGRIAGNFVVVPIELSSMHSSLAHVPGASMLGWAATLPEVRGTGAGLALTSACFAWARERGYDTMATDWRVTNLLSSRFWPRRGFRETFLRLHRAIL
jgi:GNAT superfamily N-acetyltransferase